MIFTQDEADSINGFQKAGFFHPFTCAKDHEGDRILVASANGLDCPTCGYHQMWVHLFMRDWSWKVAADAYMRLKREDSGL